LSSNDDNDADADADADAAEEVCSLISRTDIPDIGVRLIDSSPRPTVVVVTCCRRRPMSTMKCQTIAVIS
jgi:hypothetical protein